MALRHTRHSIYLHNISSTRSKAQNAGEATPTLSMRNVTSELREIQDNEEVRYLVEELDEHTIRLCNRLTRQRKDRVTDLLLELQAVIEETTSEVFQNLEEVEAAYEWLSGEICYEKYLIATDYEENFASPKSY